MEFWVTEKMNVKILGEAVQGTGKTGTDVRGRYIEE